MTVRDRLRWLVAWFALSETVCTLYILFGPRRRLPEIRRRPE
ncbi:hypothetical protein ACFV0D_12625 [Streptomyces sp. NPDC059556]